MDRVPLLPRVTCAVVATVICTLSVAAAGPAGAEEQATLDVLRIVDGEYVVDTVTVAARTAEASADELEAQPAVVAAGPSVTYQLDGTDPYWDTTDPQEKSAVRDVWSRTRGEGQVVAVLDSAVDTTHPDLAGAFVPGTDAVGGGGDNSHGTGVAGIVAARAENDIGGAGMAPEALVMPVQVCNDGGCPSAAIARGILWAADHGADVINMSLSGPGYSAVTGAAVLYALGKEISVVASSGNDGLDGNPVGYPAAHSGVVSVASNAPGGSPSDWAQHNWSVDMSTVGENTLLTAPNGTYVSGSGTSFSGPAVAGAVALLRSAVPGITPEHVQAALQAGADSSAGWNRAWGAGRLHVPSALAAADRADLGITVTPASGSVSVSWAASSGATSYAVRVDGTVRSNVSGTSTTLTGLIDGNQVAVDVQPNNGVRSRAVLATVGPAAPAVPVLHSASLSGSVVTFSASTTGPAARYSIDIDGVSIGTVPLAMTGTPTSFSVNLGTTPPTQKRFQLRGADDYGRTSAASNDVLIGSGLPSPPGAVTGLAAQVRGTNVLLTWDDFGSTITYRVSADGAPVETTSTAGAAVPAPGPGISRTYTVVAVDVWGQTGPAATTTVTGSLRSAPGAPAFAELTPGNGRVTVRWSAPGSDGGGEITGYRLRLYEDGDLFRESHYGTGLSGEVTGLTNGTAYTFVIAAQNDLGYGPSTTSAPITPRTVPTAPVIGTPTAADRSAVVRWSAPTSDGGSPVIRYTVRAYRGSSLVAVVYAPANATSVTVPGLLNRATYTFRVSAGNAAGSSPVSAASTAVVAGAPPSAPRAGTPSSGNGSVVARWGAPTNDGGYAVSAYVVKVYKGTQLLKQVLVSADVRALRVSGLPNGQSLTVTVAASNARGWSAESRPVSFVPRA